MGLCGEAQASPEVGFASSGTRGWSPRMNHASEANNGTGQPVHGGCREEVEHRDGSLAVATSSHSAAFFVSRESTAAVSTTNDMMMDAEIANNTLLESKNEGVCDVISTHDSMVD